MKKIKVIIPFFTILIFMSCNLFTPKVTNSLDINVGGPTSRNGGSTMFNDSDINSVKVRFFYESEGSLVDSELSLEKLDDRWNGTFTYEPEQITGNVIIHVMAFTGSNGEGEIKYQGSTEPNDIVNFGTSVTISTILGYDVGDRGPGGGWVIYKKDTFDDSNSKMGKSWKYLEIAPTDLEEEWATDSSKLDLDNYVVSTKSGNSGKVYKRGHINENEYLTLDTTSFYWGPAGNPAAEDETTFTSTTFEHGYENTTILDSVSSATPDKVKTKGRKDKGDQNNTRRDTVDILNEKNINNFSDWFIPSKEELEEIYDNSASISPSSVYGLNGKYWTSSEDNDGNDKVSSEDIVNGLSDFGDDANWAWSVDFDNDSENEAITVSERFQTYKVRPVRAF